MNQMRSVGFEEIKNKYLPLVEREIADFLHHSQEQTGRAMAAMTQYHFETGGKRLRALIPLYFYEAVGRNAHDLIPFGAAVEMVHNATLVHDDLQDGDEMRRNRPTIWKKHSPAQAINCGDAMFQYAFSLLGRLRLDPSVTIALMQRMATATVQVIEGQAQEFIMKDESYPGFKRYLEVIRGKTSGLFALPVVSALEAAGISSEVCKTVEALSMDLGVLFQIQDDVLDVYGEKGRALRASDVAEGKISAFVALVNDHGSQGDKQMLNQILRKPRETTTPSDIETAIGIFERNQCKQRAIDFIKEIQGRIENHVGLETQAPVVKQGLVTLGNQFLNPIREVI